ncbi:hypothetical protein NLG97_g986 [Lecanicillium saksenae]|uniref:Uncharacterized protein n=1 Tax=Lecanicillium saksenae TaxID=468837 RepID=A0ACC1R505_9HYPO|nr:hypothetical protein NLG97_g986 [Lecanicillium saksenae]
MITPFQRLCLGPLDHIAPANIPQSIIYLRLKRGVTPQNAFASLHEGLRQTILEFPFLNGLVMWQPQDVPGWRPGQLEVRYKPLSEAPMRQLRFNVLDTQLTFGDLSISGFPLDTFNRQELLWASPFELDFDKGAEVLMAQANFLPGGCLLALSVAAPVSDGTAMLSVTRQWAKYCSAASEKMDGRSDILPENSNERSNLLDFIGRDENTARYESTAPQTFRFIGFDNNEQYSTLSSDLFSADSRLQQCIGSDAAPKLRMKPRLFYLPQSAYTNLRSQCAAELGTSEVSGLHLLCALIWRSLVRAWFSVHSELETGDSGGRPVSALALPFDARPEFFGLLPERFLGNFNFERKVSVPVEELLAGGSSIGRLAKTILAEVKSTTREHLIHAYRLLSEVRDYRLLPQIRASAMVQPSVGIFAPMTLPFNEACFGDHVFGNSGKPEAFRPLMGECDLAFRTCFIIPRKQHGGIEFVITLTEEEADFLCNDGDFSSYAYPLG